MARGIAIVTVSALAIPLVKPDIVQSYGWLGKAFFPAVGMILSAAGMWFLRAEAYRLKAVRNRYNALMGPYAPYGDLERERWGAHKSIGRVIVWIIFFALFIPSAIELVVLLFWNR